jgi:hypothetical protein
MDCRGSGKGKEKAIPDSDEVCSAAGGSSKTYVVDRAGLFDTKYMSFFPSSLHLCGFFVTIDLILFQGNG